MKNKNILKEVGAFIKRSDELKSLAPYCEEYEFFKKDIESFLEYKINEEKTKEFKKIF